MSVKKMLTILGAVGFVTLGSCQLIFLKETLAGLNDIGGGLEWYPHGGGQLNNNSLSLHSDRSLRYNRVVILEGVLSITVQGLFDGTWLQGTTDSDQTFAVEAWSSSIPAIEFIPPTVNLVNGSARVCYGRYIPPQLDLRRSEADELYSRFLAGATSVTV